MTPTFFAYSSTNSTSAPFVGSRTLYISITYSYAPAAVGMYAPTSFVSTSNATMIITGVANDAN